jgi:hypothetical protein
MEQQDKSSLTVSCISMELSASFMTIRIAPITASADGTRGIAIQPWLHPVASQAAIPAEAGRDEALDWN